MSQLLSPKQVARAIGVSESSLKRWCDQGLLTVVKTAGGHRRITIQEALRFVRQQNHTVVEPQLLALPTTEDRKANRIEECTGRMVEALLANNEPACQAIVADLYLAGHALSRIFDEVVGVAFRTIGEKWACHEVEIYEERYSCQIALAVLHDLRAKLVPPNPQMTALGGTIEGDLYTIPVTMAEVVLRSVGWDARLLGSSIPIDSMISAIERQKPKLFWLSVSHITDVSAFVSDFNRLFKVASKCRTAVVAGGQALASGIQDKLQYTAHCDSMGQLEQVAITLMGNAQVKGRSDTDSHVKGTSHVQF